MTALDASSAKVQQIMQTSKHLVLFLSDVIQRIHEPNKSISQIIKQIKKGDGAMALHRNGRRNGRGFATRRKKGWKRNCNGTGEGVEETNLISDGIFLLP
jgi:hypothetical protein